MGEHCTGCGHDWHVNHAAGGVHSNPVGQLLSDDDAAHALYSGQCVAQHSPGLRIGIEPSQHGCGWTHRMLHGFTA